MSSSVIKCIPNIFGTELQETRSIIHADSESEAVKVKFNHNSQFNLINYRFFGFFFFCDKNIIKRRKQK